MIYHVNTVHCLTGNQVRGLLCSAFEGGSNYWYAGLGPHSYPVGATAADYTEGGSMQPDGEYWHWSQLLPTSGGSVSLRCVDDDADVAVLDDAAIQRGLVLFVHTTQYGELLAGDDDASTGDVFLQLCLFGSVRYG